jgi:hypothetical protein
MARWPMWPTSGNSSRISSDTSTNTNICESRLALVANRSRKVSDKHI